MHELLLKLAPAVGGLEQAENLSYEAMLVISATIEYQEIIDNLREQAESLYANPPMDDEHDQGKSATEWDESLAEVEAQLETEMNCWFYPLDHERGERLLSAKGQGPREKVQGGEPANLLGPWPLDLGPEPRSEA